MPKADGDPVSIMIYSADGACQGFNLQRQSAQQIMFTVGQRVNQHFEAGDESTVINMTYVSRIVRGKTGPKPAVRAGFVTGTALIPALR